MQLNPPTCHNFRVAILSFLSQRYNSFGFKKQQVLSCSEPVTPDRHALWKLHRCWFLTLAPLGTFLITKISRPHAYRILLFSSEVKPVVCWSQLLDFYEPWEIHIGSLKLVLVGVFIR